LKGYGMLLLTDAIDIKNIVIRHLPTSKTRSAALHQNLDSLWHDIVAEMQEKGRKIWNAELYRLEALTRTDTALHVDLSTIEVKEIHASQRIAGEYDLGESYCTCNIFVASFIETSDGYFIFGRTNTNTLNAGRIDLIGGALSKSERIVETGDDLFLAAIAEIEEELNVPREAVQSGRLCAILKTPRSYVGVIFHARLDLNRKGFEEHFGARENDEITEAILVERSELGAFLASQMSYLPSLANLPFVRGEMRQA
jgi:8-oxo-dGTP pyrophosphatase MutT (NUDIX family)